MDRYGEFCTFATKKTSFVHDTYFIPPCKDCVRSAGVDITKMVTVHNTMAPIDQVINDVEEEVYENGAAAFFYAMGFRYIGFQHADMACVILLHTPPQAQNHV